MRLHHYSLLTFTIITASYSQLAIADLKHQCLLGVPQFTGEVIQGDQTNLPIYIEADRAIIHQLNKATYIGDVDIQQGNRLLNAEEVSVEQNGEHSRNAYLRGAFSYQDTLIHATGRDARVNLTHLESELAQVDYQLVGRQGRGKADNVVVNQTRRRMKNATFTACLPDDNAWAIDASEMVQHIEEEYAEMWHARFKVMGIPIFYSPYLQFPIGDRRRSGLLIPNISHSSRDGYIYSQPFYWNIASNADMTITPTYFSRRGWQISPEYRYLMPIGEGKIAAEYLHDDELPSWRNKDRSRHLLFWQHNANFLTNWRFTADYTRVSDRHYFSDFNSQYGHNTDGYASQHFKLGYYQPRYNISITAKKFQTFDESGSKPYRVFPQIDFNFYQRNVLNRTNFSLFAQIARFENNSHEMPRAWRFHLEPALDIPFVSRLGSVNVETKLYATQYAQQAGQQAVEKIKKNVTRVLPQLKVDLSTTLVATKPLFNTFNQTLEPRLQYLYRPYVDQKVIGPSSRYNLGLGYDSALLQQDYFSLFEDRRYSGLDRIASANQITLGGTTRLFNSKTGAEIFNLSAGQIYHLNPSRVDSLAGNSTAKRSSSWAIESNWKLHQHWNWHSTYQYDTRLNETALANMSLQFKLNMDKVIQLNYRYASKNYIDQNLSHNRYGQDIKQVGMTAGWELTDNVSLMVGYYQDIALKKPVESQFGITYNSCCWNVSLYTARSLASTPQGKHDTINDIYYNNHFGINFELRFGTHYNNGVSRMLKRGIIPYTEAFNIN